MMTTLSLVLIVCTLWIIYRVSRIGRRESSLPPGPPTLPVLGNIFSFPIHHPWYKLTEIAREYGDIYSLKICSGTIIVLSSATVVSEVMEKNSGIVSDRPHSHIAHEITDGKSMVLLPFGDEWRRLRRCAGEILTVQACRNHLSIQQAEATQVMYEFLVQPENFFDSIRRYSTSVILSVLYGKRAPRLATSEIADFVEAQQRLKNLVKLDECPPVDIFPILKKVPERWASWKTKIKVIRQLQRKLYFGLLDRVEERMNEGMSNGCWMERVIEEASEFGLDREATGYLGGILIEGASETTTSFLQTLVLALVNFPEAQRLAQEEIDHVIGDERAPTLDDVEKLPYIQAVIKETHRWRPVAPLAIPHVSIEDLSYKDYLIPKGSVLFLNNWGIFHDPDVFEEPSVFNPGRWLKEDLASNRTYDLIFGCARRVCPGVHLARNSLNINAMNLIWAFNFNKAKDPVTKLDKMYDLYDFAREILTGPNHFDCIITPRSVQHDEIIRQNFLEASSTFEAFEYDASPEDGAFLSQMRDELKDGLHV